VSDVRAEAEEAWKAVLRKRGVFVSPNTPLGDAVLEARDTALLAERRRAIETCQRIADEKAQACTALADACVVGASGPYSRTERTILDKRWHTAQAAAFREAAHAIGALASPREET
jgi:hypothetical protein